MFRWNEWKQSNEFILIRINVKRHILYHVVPFVKWKEWFIKMYNIIVGYFIVINIIALLFMYVESKTELIKLKDNWINFIYIVLTILGGWIGIIVTSRLVYYKRDERLIKKVVPFIAFLEVVIVGYIIYTQLA